MSLYPLSMEEVKHVSFAVCLFSLKLVIAWCWHTEEGRLRESLWGLVSVVSVYMHSKTCIYSVFVKKILLWCSFWIKSCAEDEYMRTEAACVHHSLYMSMGAAALTSQSSCSSLLPCCQGCRSSLIASSSFFILMWPCAADKMLNSKNWLQSFNPEMDGAHVVWTLSLVYGHRWLQTSSFCCSSSFVHELWRVLIDSLTCLVNWATNLS